MIGCRALQRRGKGASVAAISVKCALVAALAASMVSSFAGGQPSAPAAPAVRAKAATAVNLCAANEQIYFSCVTMRQRAIAVCGTSPTDIQYRFGTSTKKVELTYPKEQANGAAHFAFAHYSRYQVERLELSFENRGTRYAVFDYYEEGKRDAGISIETRDGKESSLRCLRPTQSNLIALEKAVPCDRDSALNQGSCPAQ